MLSFAHQLVGQRTGSGDIVVDATVGNGNDTLFLARQVGPRGLVYGFDIQERALRSAHDRLNRELPDCSWVRLYLRSHAELADAIPHSCHGKIAAIMFNLGYLPGSDQATITRPESTIPALCAAADLLRVGGIVTVIVYSGHDGGQAEAEAVEQWVGRLPEETYQAVRYQFANRRNHPPYLLAIEKKRPDRMRNDETACRVDTNRNDPSTV